MQVSDYTALLSEWTWRSNTSNSPTVVTYALNTTIESYWDTYNPTAVVNSFQSAKTVEDTVREAFQMWEGAANIQFVQVDGNDANINIGLFNFNLDASTAGYSGYA